MKENENRKAEEQYWDQAPRLEKACAKHELICYDCMEVYDIYRNKNNYYNKHFCCLEGTLLNTEEYIMVQVLMVIIYTIYYLVI